MRVVFDSTTGKWYKCILEGIPPEDIKAIFQAKKHTDNVAQIMDEWQDATDTEPTGKEYEEYYAIRIKELENAK